MHISAGKGSRYLIEILLLALFFSVNSCKKASPTQTQSTPVSPSSDSTSLGTISYTADYSREESTTLDTNAVDISTTDANGVKWDLNVPRQDIAGGTTISITPIDNVKSDSTYDISSGVVFGPDGFQFTSPATLTVTFPSSSSPYIFYIFTQDGKSLNFAPASDTGGVYKVTIYHFSGVAAGVPFDPQKVCSQATAKYNAALKEEDALLKQPIDVPVPPDIDLDCGINSSKMKTAKDYVAKFVEPEDSVIRSILGPGAAFHLLGCNQTASLEMLAKAGALAVRLYQKGQKAYSEYGSDNKKYVAVANAMLTADADMNLLGASPSGPDETLAELGTWAKSCYTDQLNRLRQNHDYKAVKSLFQLASEAETFGADIPSFIADIQNALTFTLDLKEGVTDIGTVSGYSHIDTDHIIIQGAIKMHPVGPTANHYFGSGTINYVYGIASDMCTDNSTNKSENAHDKIVLPQSFQLSFTVDSLSACGNDVAVIRFDSLGSAAEQWIYGYDVGSQGWSCFNGSTAGWQMSANYTLTLDLNSLAFLNQPYFDFSTYSYVLRPSIHNENVNVVDTTYTTKFVSTDPQVTIDYTAQLDVKVVHTPQ